MDKQACLCAVDRVRLWSEKAQLPAFTSGLLYPHNRACLCAGGRVRLLRGRMSQSGAPGGPLSLVDPVRGAAAPAA